VIEGAVANTVTVKSAVEEFPNESVAVTVTVVVPTANIVPLAWL
jgi:hypothetical protein